MGLPIVLTLFFLLRLGVFLLQFACRQSVKATTKGTAKLQRWHPSAESRFSHEGIYY